MSAANLVAMKRAVLALAFLALASSCSPADVSQSDTASTVSSTNRPVRIPLGDVVGLPTGSADERLASLILEFVQELKAFNLLYGFPPFPEGGTVGEFVEAGSTYASLTKAAIAILESTNDEMRAYISREGVSAQSVDIEELTDEIGRWIVNQRSQNDLAGACIASIPSSLQGESIEILGSVEEFAECMSELVSMLKESPTDSGRRIADAASTMYDQLIAGVEKP